MLTYFISFKIPALYHFLRHLVSFGFILVEGDEAYVFATRKEIRVPFGYLKPPHSGDMPSQRYF